MIKYDVPHYADDTKDQARCVQACLKMILKYFLPNREFNWRDLDKITHKVSKKGTWWFGAYPTLNKLGFEIKEFGAGLYINLHRYGIYYLHKAFSPKLAKFYFKKSNIAEVIKLIPRILGLKIFNKRRASIKDIEKLIRLGYLLMADVDFSNIFSKWYGASHAVVIIGYDKDNLYIHDPAKRRGANLLIKKVIFKRVWNSRSLAALRLKHL